MSKKEVKSLHEIEVLLQAEIGILEDKKVTVGNIAPAIKDLGMNRKSQNISSRPLMKKKLRNTAATNIALVMVNNVETDFQDKNTGALKSRIDKTVAELKKMSKELWKLGCRKTARFAVTGRRVP